MFFKRLIICSFAALTFSQAAAQVLLPPEEVDKHHTNQLISRINQLVSRIVPRTISGIPTEQRVSVDFPDREEQQAFFINTKRSTIRISLPHGFNRWAFQPETIFPFVHTYLSAKTGSKIPIRDAWITAAIIHDLYEPGTIYGASGFRYTPYARAMLAHGYAPSVKELLDSRIPDFYEQFSSAARMEWCALLLRQTTRRVPSFEQFLFRNRNLLPSERFEKILSAPAKKGKTFFGENGRSRQEWFTEVCTRSVLGRGIPAAVPLLEESFSGIMEEIHPLLKVPEVKKGKKVPVLSNETVKALARAEMKLNFLALIAPEQIALKLYRCAGRIREFRLNPPTANAIKKILAEKRALYTAFSERAALELALKQAEQRLIPPGMRFALTLQAVAPAKPEIPLLEKAHSLMDRYE